MAVGSEFVKGAGIVLGTIGVGFTAYDMYANGVTTSNSLDFAMGIVSMVPGWGWAVGAIYFAGNAAIKATTGEDIGQHINGWIK